MVLGDPLPAGQALMRAYIGETMLSSGRVYMPERGIGSLSEALAAACSDAIRVSTPVRKVVVADGTVTGVAVDGENIEADAVICAVPGTKVPDIIPDLPEETRRALSTVSYSTGCRVVIGLDHPPLPPGWHGALFPEDDDTPLLLDRTAFLPACAPPSKSILDLLTGRDRAKELIPLDDDEIKQHMLGAARRKAPPGSALPDDDEGLFYRVYRWEEALCMGTPGMLAAMRTSRSSLQEASTTCSWRASTWPCRRSTALSPVATAPQWKSQTCWRPAPTKRRCGQSRPDHTSMALQLLADLPGRPKQSRRTDADSTSGSRRRPTLRQHPHDWGLSG